MNKQLLILPFDHRSSFIKLLFGNSKKLNTKQKQEIKKLKKIIFEAFLVIFKKYQASDQLGILLDQEYGQELLTAAKNKKITVCVSVEKSGQSEFKFEYGNNFGSQIKKINPDYVKALVRYHPFNKKVNKRQLLKLKKLSNFCQQENYSLMIELLVPATTKDLKISGSEKKYDEKLRLSRTIQSIKEITKQIKVDIWKLEWFSSAGWKKVLQLVNKDEQVIFLGRGEDKRKVREWLLTAVKFNQIIGFAIGRTIFIKAIEEYHQRKINRAETIKKIADNYDYFIKLWLKNRKIKLK